MIFIQQGGSNRHEHICESLELFAAAVMPEFKERDADARPRKNAELAPYIERALGPQAAQAPLAEAEIPSIAGARPAAGAAGVSRWQDRQLRPRQRDAGAARGPAEEGVEIDTRKRGC